MKSVLVDDTEHCFFCGRPYPEAHHALSGTGRRKIADKYKMIIPLCHECHMRLHDTGQGKRLLQIVAQDWYEENVGTREQFIEEFGKSFKE